MSYTCRILAIDGGGIRGVIPAYVLAQLETALGKPVFECFDIVAGTSTGGLIALGLTTPVSSGDLPRSAETILNLYMNDEANLFVYQSSGDTYEAKYYATYETEGYLTGIQPWIQELFATTTLSQAQAQLALLNKPMPKQVLTTCYTLNGANGSYGPYLFNWVSATANAADDYCVWEAGRGTSAAPTYFPLANVGGGGGGGQSNAAQRWVADGGVTANNPALYALAEGFKLGLCNSLSDVLIVSLGTGLYSAGVEVPADTGDDDADGNWGALDWADGTDTNGNTTSPLLNVLAMSNQMAPDQQLQLIMPAGNYFRLEPLLPFGESAMDGSDAAALLATATGYIAQGGAGYANFEAIVAAL